MSVAQAVSYSDGQSRLVDVATFDRATRSEAIELVRPCCASRRWVSELTVGRPYRSLRPLMSASDDIIGDLRWSDIAEALAAYSRIGDRALGQGRESPWSRQERSATTGVKASVAEQLRAGKAAYEQRFGHVFLACATGRSAEQILSALQQRITNPTVFEREVVRAELSSIVRHRLIKTFR